MRSRSGMARTKLPPRPIKPRTSPLRMRLAGIDRVEALVARRLEAVLLLQPIERHQFGFLGDADGALALHVRMAAHRADAGARLADIAAQQQQVDQHLHGLDAVLVLGQAHAVNADDRCLAGRRRGGRFHRAAGQARSRLSSSAQSCARTHSANSSKPCVCSVDEGAVEHRPVRLFAPASSASINALQMPDRWRPCRRPTSPGDNAC